MTPTLFLTDDGSHSLRSSRFGASYHSTHGAIQESQHIFIEAGLLPLLAQEPDRLVIIEMGFGSGLNALLVRLIAARHPATRFAYLTYEQYPIDAGSAQSLNYPALLGVPRGLLDELHELAWGRPQLLDANFTLHKLRADFLSRDLPMDVAADLFFYDAFAPEIQPELWTEQAMRRCAGALRTGGVLVTYCAKGQFKRNLRTAGFRVEALPGPVGKREITRAVRLPL